ncbi:glycoside hydrolase family 108 protein [Magnetococcales bacterium HHB-1]
MAEFERAIDLVLRHEGGFVNDPKDPGGATKYGISLRFLRSLGHELADVDGDGDIDADDIRALSVDGAKDIYRAQFWNRYGYNRIHDQDIATKLFDLSVNMGPKQAHKILQRALWAVRHAVKVDGILGGETFGAVQRVRTDLLLVAMRSEAAGFYRSLIIRRPELGKYRRGWMRRAYT